MNSRVHFLEVAELLDCDCMFLLIAILVGCFVDLAKGALANLLDGSDVAEKNPRVLVKFLLHYSLNSK